MRSSIFFLLFFLALTSVDTVSVSPPDSFIFDVLNVSVSRSLEDAVVVSYDGVSSEILRVDECISSNILFACLEDADNSSARFDVLEQEADLTLSRSVASSASVGSEVLVEYVLANVGERDVSGVFVENVSGVVDVLFEWDFSLRSGDDVSFEYSFIPHQSGDVEFVSEVFSAVNVSESGRLSVSDVLDFDVEYADAPSFGVEDSFVVSLTPRVSVVETSVSVVVPDFLNVTDGRLSRLFDLNESEEFTVFYTPLTRGNGSFELIIETPGNDSDVTRSVSYPVVTQETYPLLVSSSVANKTYRPKSVFSEEVVVFNPNAEDKTVLLQVSSGQFTSSESVVIPANDSFVYPVSYQLNATGEGALRVNASFEDADGRVISSVLFDRFFIGVPRFSVSVSNSSFDQGISESSPDSAVFSSQGVLSLSGPVLLYEGSEDVLVASGNASGNISWYREGSLVFQEDFTGSSSYVISSGGLYEVVVSSSSGVVRESYYVSFVPVFDVQNATIVSDPPRVSVLSVVLAVLVVILVTLGLFVYRARKLASEYEELLALYEQNKYKR